MINRCPGQPRPDPDEWACRRFFTWQLQPVRGRDFLDGIRSGSIFSLQLSKRLIATFQKTFLCLHLRSVTELNSAYSRDLTETNCRRFFTWQLRPVRGRDLLDRIRSGCHDFSCNFQRITCLISQELSQVIWSAGSATAANCSLCEAGTFGTGSGQGALIGLSLLHLT